jgi:hypothetical protein
MKSQQKPRTRKTVPNADAARCLHTTSDGKRCRLPRSGAHPALCFDHARREQQLRDADRVAAELASLSGEFKTANDLNHVLGKLFTLIAQNRIPTRNAALLAYVGQLLLHSLESVKREILRVQGTAAWEQTLLRTFMKQLPPSAPASPGHAGNGSSS